MKIRQRIYHITVRKSGHLNQTVVFSPHGWNYRHAKYKLIKYLSRLNKDPEGDRYEIIEGGMV